MTAREGARSIQELLIDRADCDKPWLVLPSDPVHGADAARVTYAETYRESLRWATALLGHGGKPREAVGLVFDNGPGFCFAFFGALLAGMVPVPLPPPFLGGRREEYVSRTRRVLAGARAGIVVVDAAYEALAESLPDASCRVLGRGVLEQTGASAAGAAPHRGGPEEAAFLRYTSGSAASPRGARLSHAGVLSSARGTGLALHGHEDQTALCWVPLFHELGLTGALVYTMYWGMSLVLMSPIDFMADPASWLWAMARFGVDGCAAPNFAYALCASRKKIPDRALEGLDLGRWDVAVNAAETIQAPTLEAFEARFAPYGFRREAWVPCYGLAEAAGACSVSEHRASPRVDHVDGKALEAESAARPVPRSAHGALAVVGVGTPIAEHEIRVVDARGSALGDRFVGEIHARGPSVMSGYHDAPEASRRVLGADGWLATGDLGYRVDGDLFVVGRIKDVVKKAGATYEAADIQSVVSRVSGARAGRAAVFGVLDAASGSEQIVVVCETAVFGERGLADLHRAVVHAIWRALEVHPDVVRFVRVDALPTGPDGTVTHAVARRLYLDGELPLRAL
jgi:acyl-CoA synthetase (AMP-forming)/AMP-acid ligase II